MKREAKKTKRERKASETPEERQRRLEAQRAQAQKHHKTYHSAEARQWEEPPPPTRPQGATAYLLGMAAALGGGIAPLFFRGCR